MILKSAILEFINQVLNREEVSVDSSLELVLAHISDAHLFVKEDTTLTVTSSSYYISFPSDMLADQQALVSLVLTDSSLNREYPCEALPGGWSEYQRCMESFGDSARSTPSYYVAQNRRLYLYPAPDGDYTCDLWYKARNADADAILLGDEWEPCVKYGTAFEVACKFGLANGMSIWGPRYTAEFDTQKNTHSDEVHVVSGCNDFYG